MNRLAQSAVLGAMAGIALGLATTAQSAGVAVVGKISTLGLGADLVVPFSERVNLRLIGHYGGVEYEDTQKAVDYDVEARLRSGGALLDWHPAAGAFRVSLGALYNGNKLDGSARPQEPKNIGDLTFTPAEIGTLTATVKFPKLAGYAGIGFGNAVAPGSRWTVTLDLGVLFYSSPDFTLEADGALAGDPIFEANLAKERDAIEDDYVRAARFYPVLSLGIGFRF